MTNKEVGLATLKCEVMELEREVVRPTEHPEWMRKEAIQSAAMAIKFVRDICDKDTVRKQLSTEVINLPTGGGMGKTLVVVINGAAGTGKDTFVEFVRAHLAQRGLVSSNHSSVGLVKEAALILGWDGEKDEQGRQFLSDLKDLSTNTYDGPMKYMTELITQLKHDVMFFHIREPLEIAKFLETHPGAISILVHRDGAQGFGNHADQNVKNHPYDYEIRNNAGLADLSVVGEEIAEHCMILHKELQEKETFNATG